MSTADHYEKNCIVLGGIRFRPLKSLESNDSTTSTSNRPPWEDNVCAVQLRDHVDYCAWNHFPKRQKCTYFIPAPPIPASSPSFPASLIPTPPSSSTSLSSPKPSPTDEAPKRKRGRPRKGEEVPWVSAVDGLPKLKNLATRTRNNPEATKPDDSGVQSERQPKRTAEERLKSEEEKRLKREEKMRECLEKGLTYFTPPGRKKKEVKARGRKGQQLKRLRELTENDDAPADGPNDVAVDEAEAPAKRARQDPVAEDAMIPIGEEEELTLQEEMEMEMVVEQGEAVEEVDHLHRFFVVMVVLFYLALRHRRRRNELM